MFFMLPAELKGPHHTYKNIEICEVIGMLITSTAVIVFYNNIYAYRNIELYTLTIYNFYLSIIPQQRWGEKS